MTYQKTTGTLSPGAHAGSYNGQDAYNDMLVVDDGSILHRKLASKSTEIEQDGRCFELHGRPDEATLLYRGGETAQTIDASYYKGTGTRNGMEREVIATEPAYMSDRKGHSGITEDGTATTLTAQEKERPIVGGGDAMTSVVRRLTPLE